MKKILNLENADRSKIIGVLHEPDTQLGFKSPIQFMPVEIHLIPNGDRDNKPSIALLSTRNDNNTYVNQMSLKMLNEALKDVGYEIVEK